MSFGTLINPSHCHSSYNPLNKLSQHIQTDYSLRKELWNNNEESTKIKNVTFRSKKTEKSTVDNIPSSQVLAEEFHQYQQHNNPNYFIFPPKKSFLFHQNNDNQPIDTTLSTSWHSSSPTPSSSTNKYNNKVHSLLTEFENFEQPSSSSTSSILRQNIPLYNQRHYHQHHHFPSRTNIKPMNMYNSNVNKNINIENSLQEDWEKAFRTFDHQQKVTTPTAIDHTSSIKNRMEQLEDIQIDYMGPIDDNKYQNDLLEQQQEKEDRASTSHTTETLSAIQWKNLGMTFQENNDDKSAIQAFNNAVNIDTSLTDAWLGLAISYANEHSRGKVYDCLFSWLLNNQHYQSIIKHDLLFLEKEGKYDDGLVMNEVQGNHDYEEQLLYKKHQQLIELYLKVARSIPGHGEINSITNSNKEITIDPDVQVILGLLFYLSKEEKKMMDMEKAMDCFETALSYKSDDYRVWNQLGAIFAQQPHQHHQAVEMYQSALQLNKSFIRARYNLAILLMKMGLYEQAAHHLAVALMDQQTSIMEINDIYKSSFDSTEIWSSLRLVMYMLNLDHLAEACNQKDLSQFDYFIHLEN